MEVHVDTELLMRLRDHLADQIREQDAGTEGVATDLIGLHADVCQLLPGHDSVRARFAVKCFRCRATVRAESYRWYRVRAAIRSASDPEVKTFCSLLCLAEWTMRNLMPKSVRRVIKLVTGRRA